MSSKKTKNLKRKRQNTPKSYVNLHHKDRLFRFLFRDRKHLLELYNALNGTDYENERELTITTLEGVIYMGMKNDLSFMVDSVMNLYEHQTGGRYGGRQLYSGWDSGGYPDQFKNGGDGYAVGGI